MSNNIELFDFDARFTKDYLKWCTQHQEQAQDADKMDELMPHMFERWMNTKKKWLNNKTPIEYFKDINDISVYLTLFIEYIKNDMSIPEPLLDCIVERKEEAYPTFLNILYSKSTDDMDEEQFEQLLSASVAMIHEMGLEHPYIRYIQMLINMEESSDFAEAICEILESLLFEDNELKDKLIAAYKVSNGYAKKCFLDLLSNYIADKDVSEILIEEFNKAEKEDLPFLATKLAEQGAEGSEQLLRKALMRLDIEYYEYNAIKNALESITGEVEEDVRDFTGDPIYDIFAVDNDEEE